MRSLRSRWCVPATIRRGALALALLVATAHTPPLRAQQPTAGAGARATPQGVLVDFQDADIRVVIDALSEAAGINLVHGPLPAVRLTMRLHQPVPLDSVRPLLRALATAHGFRITESAGVMRIDGPPAPEPVAPARPPQPETPQLFIYRLRHARAARLAATLQSIFGGGTGDAGGTLELSQRPLSERLREQQIAPMRLDTVGGRRGVVAGMQPSAGLPARMEGDVQIVPEETTNSLLVRATPADWAIIEQAVRAIDVRPLQVLIEVLIAEVRRSKELDVGVSGTIKHTPDGAAAPNATGEMGGDASAASPGEIILKWMSGGSVDVNVALRVLATRGDVRILARPVLLAQNNQEAHILVGSQRPFVQVFRSLPTDAGVRDQIVQYRDVGTSLTILPTVNPDGYVNLQLSQEVSSATNETQFGAPVISTREAQTFLFVRDGQTAVIGGLVDRQSEHTRTGIPLLIDIPALGALFGTTRNTTSNSELFLFLTPHLVQTDDDVDRLREGVEQRLRAIPGEIRKSPPIVPPADSAARRPPDEQLR